MIEALLGNVFGGQIQSSRFSLEVEISSVELGNDECKEAVLVFGARGRSMEIFSV